MGSENKTVDYSRGPCLGADQKTSGLDLYTRLPILQNPEITKPYRGFNRILPRSRGTLSSALLRAGIEKTKGYLLVAAFIPRVKDPVNEIAPFPSVHA